jgi:hypothetical protein
MLVALNQIADTKPDSMCALLLVYAHQGPQSLLCQPVAELYCALAQLTGQQVGANATLTCC